MGTYSTIGAWLTDICDAIRYKRGDDPEEPKILIPHSNIADEIRAIPTGGGFGEIPNMAYMFYQGARYPAYNMLMTSAKNVTNWTQCFNGLSEALPNNKINFFQDILQKTSENGAAMTNAFYGKSLLLPQKMTFVQAVPPYSYRIKDLSNAFVNTAIVQPFDEAQQAGAVFMGLKKCVNLAAAFYNAMVSSITIMHNNGEDYCEVIGSLNNFAACGADTRYNTLETIDIRGVKMHDYSTMNTFAQGRKGLKHVTFCDVNGGMKPTSLANAFNGCIELEDVTNMEKFDYTNLTGGCLNAFCNCAKLKRYDDYIDFSNVTNYVNAQGYLYRCSGLEYIDLGNHFQNLQSLISYTGNNAILQPFGMLNGSPTIFEMNNLQTLILGKESGAGRIAAATTPGTITLQLGVIKTISDSVMAGLADSLADVRSDAGGRKIQVSQTTYNRMTTATKALFTNKGYQLFY